MAQCELCVPQGETEAVVAVAAGAVADGMAMEVVNEVEATA